MNTSSRITSRTTSSGGRHLAGFTLSDLMTALLLFSLVVLGVVYTHLFSLRMFRITVTKLSASAGARRSLDLLTNSQNNRVVRMTLEFFQWDFPVARSRAGSYYDYYRLQTRIAQRTIE